MVSNVWRYATALDAKERADALGLLSTLDLQLGREAIDENRRRQVQHNLTGHYWLAYQDGALTHIAIEDRTNGPSIEVAGGSFDPDLARELLSHHAHVDWWLRGDDALAVNATPARSLRYLETENLHLETPATEMSIRNFQPGRDDQQWLDQNNAAFAHHPEQGRWDLATLQARLGEPWFDPSGFLLFFDGDKLAASCWTKIHEFNTTRTGEIYVISVHPEYQGRRLGLTTLLHGLASIHSRGVHRASLFVEDSNSAALALYEGVGFTTVRTDHVVRITR